jgi:hypothetical protein
MLVAKHDINNIDIKEQPPLSRGLLGVTDLPIMNQKRFVTLTMR